jgi:23S rRNA pseudoU1915 N3-methylase RlmH
MNRAYYRSSIIDFITEDKNSILGKLSLNNSNRSLEDLQKNAWVKQIEILKDQLYGIAGHVYFEFAIPRMGKRVDNIVVTKDSIFVIEFKVGDGGYEKHAQAQVIDYALDLKNFHEGSHTTRLIPVLVATNAHESQYKQGSVLKLASVAKTNKKGLYNLIKDFTQESNQNIDAYKWENSIYKPTPTIVEAAQALYKGHNVKEISRSDSGAINLSKTSECLNRIIDDSKQNNKKSICFVTGVPGSGKTLAGLNIANERMKTDEDEHAVFLSGNGPLVEVLREALTRDLVLNTKENGEKITKENAKRKTNAFIQNIHHFRDEYLKHHIEPTEKVVVFDEAQRAWNTHQVSSFMKRKKGIEDFAMSEPEFLIDVMNRHKNWCTVICLIGGGQEINTGEAGLEEWICAFEEKYSHWNVHYSNLITDGAIYIKTECQKDWLTQNAYSEEELHLSVSVRSFRSEKISAFIHELLNLNVDSAKRLYTEVKSDFPILMSRDLESAKQWVRNKAKGSERTGLIASSGAKRLRPIGIDVKNEISAPNWFLNDKDDIRSSYFLEDIATEFDIQGLEIDWTCLAWGANFHIKDGKWKYQNFKGSRWMNINQDITKAYLKNTYRVLLTRARQGMVILIPNGSKLDHTRPNEFYDETWEYMKQIGIEELNNSVQCRV